MVGLITSVFLSAVSQLLGILQDSRPWATSSCWDLERNSYSGFSTFVFESHKAH